jgi:branched-chain amino acid transport system permease protein
MFPNYRLFVMAFGALLIFAVWLLIYKTQIGAIVRAAAFDKEMSSSLGIPVMLVYALTFALGVALAGLAGVLLAPIYSVFPTMGHDFILLAFSVVIVGGLGSIKGAVVAGILLTQLQSISSLYISPVWSDPLVFTVMVLVLMFKPTGLYGGMKNG